MLDVPPDTTGDKPGGVEGGSLVIKHDFFLSKVYQAKRVDPPYLLSLVSYF